MVRRNNGGSIHINHMEYFRNRQQQNSQQYNQYDYEHFDSGESTGQQNYDVFRNDKNF
ncbi:GH18048 [Drosophila grimshawi]|uniref:GH18048 n=2 Tax=Drosophila grimshawi TaxID=7222 RepID=B4JHP3_DROGR|nr:GH18048 [Drosophila grimshawi]